MMNRSAWCVFWSRPISRVFWRCWMHWAGISRLKRRYREFIPPDLRPSRRSKKSSANTQRKILERLCSKRRNDRLAANALETEIPKPKLQPNCELQIRKHSTSEIAPGKLGFQPDSADNLPACRPRIHGRTR